MWGEELIKFCLQNFNLSLEIEMGKLTVGQDEQARIGRLVIDSWLDC
tara:strand:- start:7809 stop:7949 length:141 start_codon:yes stop_codon:yes gene_type:complete